MRQRIVSAAAATSALLIGTALPSTATSTTPVVGSCEAVFGLQTLLQSPPDPDQDGPYLAESNQNDIAIGTVSEDYRSLDVELIDHSYEIKLVRLGGEASFTDHEEGPFTGLTLDSGDVIYGWMVCGQKIKESPTPTPTDTEPTTVPSPTETKATAEPTRTRSPKPVPTELPAGSSTTSGDTPWTLFGLAVAGAMAAAGAGAVVGRRNANGG